MALDPKSNWPIEATTIRRALDAAKPFSSVSASIRDQLRVAQKSLGPGVEIQRLLQSQQKAIEAWTYPSAALLRDMGASLRGAKVAIDALRADADMATIALIRFQKALQPNIADHIRRLNEPYAKVLEQARRDFARVGVGLAEKVRGLNLPVIEPHAAADVASTLSDEDVFELFAFVEATTSNDDNASAEVSREAHVPALAYWGLLNLLVILLVALYILSARGDGASTGSNLGANDNLTRRVQILESLLSELLQESNAIERPSSRNLMVRARPAIVWESPRGQRIGVLYPNQLVEELGQDGKWALVRFCEVSNLTESEGWILKKYVRRVSREQPSAYSLS